MQNKIIIAIDGFAGCGKSTTAKAVAKALRYIYIDTGAMYRAVTLYLLRNQIDISDEFAVKASLPDVHLDFHYNIHTDRTEIYLNNQSVEEEIRGMEVSGKVSEVSAIAEVRHFLVAQQQRMGFGKGIVMDGRDIGTVVFPNAEVKIFMTADIVERAKRRQAEMRAKNQDVSLDELVDNMRHRDHLDSSRKEGPLKMAENAHLIDTTQLTIDQQVEHIIEIVKQYQEQLVNV